MCPAEVRVLSWAIVLQEEGLLYVAGVFAIKRKKCSTFNSVKYTYCGGHF